MIREEGVAAHPTLEAGAYYHLKRLEKLGVPNEHIFNLEEQKTHAELSQ
jgi:hypothetical protein